MTDDLTLLRALRPDVHGLDQVTVTRARRAVLRRAVATRRRRSRRIALAGVAAAAVVALVVGLGLPGGTGRQSAVAAQLAAAHLATTPGVGDDQYLRIRQVMRTWGDGSPGAVDPWVLERYVPGDRTGTWVERSGDPGNLDVVETNDWGPALYVQHSSDPATLLEELRDHAESQQEGSDAHAVWTVAFWMAHDPVAPQTFKDDVMRAVALLDEVRVEDPAFSLGGLEGRALALLGKYEVQFVVDPATGGFRGLVGHPEKDETWVGPEEPMWTMVFETSVVDSLPRG